MSTEDKLRRALKLFTQHYPNGINPYLDEAYSLAREAFATTQEQPAQFNTVKEFDQFYADNPQFVRLRRLDPDGRQFTQNMVIVSEDGPVLTLRRWDA